MNNRLEEYRQLVQSTTKDITHIGTLISDDSLFIDVKIVFGSQYQVVSIPISDIEANLHNSKEFVKLIAKPLENMITPR